MQCWTCKGTGHRSPDCGNNKVQARAYQIEEDPAKEAELQGMTTDEPGTAAIWAMTEDRCREAMAAWDKDIHECSDPAETE